MTQTLQTRYGRLRLPNEQSDLIGRFLRTYGEWAPYEAQFVAGAIPVGARVADIGAFVGTFGLGLMAYQSLSSVCFVEGNPDTVPLLRDNVAYNASVSCVVVEALVVPSSMRGLLTGSVEPGNAGSFSVSVGSGDERLSAVVAERQLTLGEIWLEHGPFDLIKMDIEGLENAVLDEEIGLVRTCGAAFWLECNESGVSIKMCQTLLDAGLDVYYCAFPVAMAENYNRSDTILLPWAYESGLWAGRGPPPLMSSKLLAAGCIMEWVRTSDELRAAMWRTPRWSPMSWAGKGASTIVAEACHTILGENFDDYLPNATAKMRPGSWSKPLLAVHHARIVNLSDRLAQAQAALRATEIVLHSERERMALQVDNLVALNATVGALSGQIDIFEKSTTSRLVRRVHRAVHASPTLVKWSRPIVRAARWFLRGG